MMRHAESLKPTVTPAPAATLQRCGAAPFPSGRCEHENENEGPVLRRLGAGTGPRTAPPIVLDVLAAPGRPLDTPTRATMRARFGQDFSGVRVHTDAHAARSARAIQASAYTVGQHVVFDAGRFAPSSPAGAELLAHELTHVVQQAGQIGRPIPARLEIGAPDAPSELQARAVAAGRPPGAWTRRHGPTALRRQPAPPGSDARADLIIQAATGPGDDATRAVRAVRDIISSYFAADAGLVSDVVYVERQDGLLTTTGAGTAATGVITVGKQFLNGTTRREFAHRVLQVDHELEHVRQHRQGMGGQSRQPEREYLAFRREALAAPPTGTGRLQHSTRVLIIDAALRNYCLLSADLQTTYTQQRAELLTLRTREQAASGNPATAPPTCGQGSSIQPGSPQAVRQGTAIARVSVPAQPAAAQGSDGPRLGVDVTVSGQANLAAADTFNPRDPARTLSAPTLRGGLTPGAGDLGAAVGIIGVCRDCNIRPWPGGWNLGHEIQGQLSAGIVSGVPSQFTVLGLSGSMDVFHRQVRTALGLFDWHALTAQAYANIATPDRPSLAHPAVQLGGGLGSGLELHPGQQNRFSLTAALMVVGQDSIDLAVGGHSGSGAIVFQLSVTANLLHP